MPLADSTTLRVGDSLGILDRRGGLPIPENPVMRSILVVLFLPLFAFAQEALQEQVTVSYVEVPVTVTRDGIPVRGLTSANFEIFDEGTKRPVESFEAVDFAAADTGRTISPLNAASRRNFLLLFDLSYSNPVAVGRAQQAARNFVARSIGRRDLVAVAVLDVDRGFRFLTAFTTDRELLTAAIADPTNFRSSDPLQIAGTNPLATTDSNGTSDSNARSNTDSKQSVYDETAADFKRATDRMDDTFNRTRIRKQVETLGAIAQSLQRLSGRKHLVLLSEGFDPRLVQGRSGIGGREHADENRAIENGEVWKVDSAGRFGDAASQKRIGAMAEEFRRADVILHAVDIQGVRVQNDARSGARVNSNDGLFLLANSTGGTVFRNSNDISAEFDRLTRQHEVVYVLGFHAPAGRAGEFRALRVRLIDVPRARLEHRGGYYAAGSENAVARALTTAEVIVNDIPQDEIGISALAAAFPSASSSALVPVVIEISGSDLVEHARGGIATVDVFTYAFDADGVVRDSLHQRMRLDMKKVGDRLAQNGIRFYGTLRLPPGRFAIKNLVRVAETDMKGYERVDVDVPAPGEVTVVRPLFFQEADDWVMVKATRDAADTPYPFVLDGEPFIPATRATLREGEPRLFTVFVYHAGADELTWTIAPEAKLVSRTSGEVVTKYVFAIESFPPDLKQLDVTVRKKGSTDSRTVTVPLFIR